MRRVARTAVEIIGIAATIGSILLGGWWFLSSYLPVLFVIAVVGSAAVLLVFAATHGYYIGWVNHWGDDAAEAVARIRSFQHRFRLFSFGAVVALSLTLSVVSMFYNITVAVLLLLIGVAVGWWSLHRIRRPPGYRHGR